MSSTTKKEARSGDNKQEEKSGDNKQEEKSSDNEQGKAPTQNAAKSPLNPKVGSSWCTPLTCGLIIICVTVTFNITIWQVRIFFDDYIHTHDRLRIDADRRIEEKRIDAKRSVMEAALKPQWAGEATQEEKGWFTTTIKRLPNADYVIPLEHIKHLLGILDEELKEHD